MSQLDRDYTRQTEYQRLLEQNQRAQGLARLLLVIVGLGLIWAVTLAALLGFLR
jgi:hypothetical protein